MSFAESKEVCSPEVPSSVFRALLYWRLLCLSSCFVDPYPDSGRVGRRYEDLGRLGRGFRAPAFILPLAALPPSSWSAAFALLQRRVGSRRASHPSPPPSPHQSTYLSASKRPLNQDLFLNQVNPGVSKEGRAIFDVTPDARGLILRCGDTNPFIGKNAYVDLRT